MPPHPAPAGRLKITQVYRDSGGRREHVELVDAGARHHDFAFPASANVRNEAVVLSSAP